MDFKVETIVNFDKAIWRFNKQLFVFDSLAALKQELARYTVGFLYLSNRYG